jgi:hypothetical protein
MYWLSRNAPLSLSNNRPALMTVVRDGCSSMARAWGCKAAAADRIRRNAGNGLLILGLKA